MKPLMPFTLALAVTTLLASGVMAGEHHADKAKNADLDRFKALVGTWEMTGMQDEHGPGGPATVTYKITAGGNAVLETVFAGSEHEMVTLYYVEGDGLALTHYCMLGNQPQMKAMPKAGDNKIAFEFVKATNLKSEKDMCMRSVTFTFVDKDTLKTEWTMYHDGKAAEKMVFDLKRKK